MSGYDLLHKKTRLFGGGFFVFKIFIYNEIPPPCSAGIIMTTTIMTTIV